MIVSVASIVWASVVVYLLVRLEINFKAWLAHQSPLNDRQAQELRAKLDDLQNQINSLAVRKEFD